MLDLVETTLTSPVGLDHFLSPIFDEKGLIPCIAQDAESKQVLFFESMDRRAYERTIRTGLAH